LTLSNNAYDKSINEKIPFVRLINENNVNYFIIY
jgi:hypothetical protein